MGAAVSPWAGGWAVSSGSVPKAPPRLVAGALAAFAEPLSLAFAVAIFPSAPQCGSGVDA